MSSEETNWTFTYDADGMRTGRTNGTVTYAYVYNGSQLSRMHYGDIELEFTYDSMGRPLSVYYNGVVYYYALNLQGDVVAILNSSGAQVVGYTYDAWGKLLTATGSMASTLGLHNPLRYRGYVYDTETQLYYLQSRYYNPEWGRFINADSQLSPDELSGLNMFSYCGNNPVNRYDPTGHFWDYVLDAVFIAWGTYDLINGGYKDWKSWVALGVDIVFAALPFVTSGAGQVLKVGNKIDDAVNVVSAINTIDNIQDGSKITIIGRNMERVTDTATLIGKADNLYDGWRGYDAAATGLKRVVHNGIFMFHNAGWMFGTLRSGYTVIDIGITTAHKGFGLFYGAERFVVGLWETRNIWKIPINLYF